MNDETTDGDEHGRRNLEKKIARTEKKTCIGQQTYRYLYNNKRPETRGKHKRPTGQTVKGKVMATTTATTATATDALRAFANINRPKFASFEYVNEYERARVVVLLGVNLENVYNRDLRALRQAMEIETDALRLQAIGECIASIENSLSKGIGNNDAYTNADTYETLGANIKTHKETGDLYVSGFLINKIVLETFAQRPTKNSRPLTIAKDAVKFRYTRMAKWRQYKVSPDNMATVSASGNRLILSK